MLNTKFIRDNKALVAENNKSRNVTVDLDELLRTDEEKNKLQKKIDDLRAERNERSKVKPTDDEIKLMRKLGDEITSLENLMSEKKKYLDRLLYALPNLNHESTPVGSDAGGNVVERQVGELPSFNFKPQEHHEIKNVMELVDLERGAKVSGSRFYFLKGKLAALERAIMQFAIDKVTAKNFELMLPPMVVKEEAMLGTGFFPAEKSEVYAVDYENAGLYLAGTSEVPLVFYHGNEVLSENELPKKYVGFSPCFRREAGSYGKDTRGIFRVHQFYKVEMVILCKPDESWDWHEKLLSIEEDIMRELGISYRVVNICSGDLGFPAAKKYDCEAWFPGQRRYRELTSASNTTDYQARRSNIRFKTADGKRELVHTLNGTVVADRALIAIMENYQQKDGGIVVPGVLRKYTGFEKI